MKLKLCYTKMVLCLYNFVFTVRTYKYLFPQSLPEKRGDGVGMFSNQSSEPQSS